MKTKRSISIFILMISAMMLSYTSIYIVSLNFNVSNWSATDRAVFLLYFIISFFLIMFYCRNHMIPGEYGRDEEKKISFLSVNWFKKLASVFFIYSITFLISFFVLSFCRFSFEFNKIDYFGRWMFVLLTSFATIGVFTLVYNNVIKLFKIEI